MEESKIKIEKFIHNYLDKVSKKTAPPVDYFKFTKRGLTEEEIQEILIDYVLKGNADKAYDIGIEKFFNYEILARLLKNDKTKEKVIKLYKEIYQFFRIYNEIENLLVVSNFNLYFLIGLESFYDFTKFPSVKFFNLLNYITKNEKWNDPEIQKFFLYFFDNEEYIKEFSIPIFGHFKFMGSTLQKYLINRGFIDYIYHKNISELLNNENISPDVKNLIMKKFQILDEDPNDVVNFYRSIPEEYQKSLFPTQKDFYMWLGDNSQHDEVFNAIDNSFNEEQVELFFRYNPDWASNLSEEPKVKLKYEIKGVPDFVKNSINLPMVEEVTFDGEDIERMFADYRDYPSVWVRYYVDEELWDHTVTWDYNPDKTTIKQYYWDDLTEDNLNKIKEILKKENPELDLDDEDEVKDAAFENDKISSALYSAAADGERSGDEAELIKDIKNGINELFSRGNWSHSEPGVIKAKVDISNYDRELIMNAYNDCGEWDVRCIFFIIRKDYIERRDMPSLSKYRNGDFDKSQFNDYIEGNL